MLLRVADLILFSTRPNILHHLASSTTSSRILGHILETMPHARDVSRAAGICRAFRVLAHVRPTRPDGKILPTLVEAKRRESCEGHAMPVTCVAGTPEGDIITASSSGHIKMWPQPARQTGARTDARTIEARKAGDDVRAGDVCGLVVLPPTPQGHALGEGVRRVVSLSNSRYKFGHISNHVDVWNLENGARVENRATADIRSRRSDDPFSDAPSVTCIAAMSDDTSTVVLGYLTAWSSATSTAARSQPCRRCA